ncbi:hypothetical protein CS8_041790 [Cupriavidus sp. 8B]
MERDQRGEELVAVERAFQRGRVAIGAGGRGLLQPIDAALHRKQPGQRAQDYQADGKCRGEAPPGSAAIAWRVHQAGGSGIMHGEEIVGMWHRRMRWDTRR